MLVKKGHQEGNRKIEEEEMNKKKIYLQKP